MNENLKKYTELDKQIRKIEKELNASEARKKGSQLGLALKDAEENLNKMEKRSEELADMFAKTKNSFEAQLKLIQEYEGCVDSSKDEQELNYLQKKLADLIRNVVTIERNLAAIAKEMSDISRSFDDYRKKVPTIQKEYRYWREQFDQMRKECLPEVNSIKAQMREVEQTLDPRIVDKFKKLKEQGIYPPFVQIAENRCSGCRVEIPNGQLSTLESVGYVECENCHRVVYKAEVAAEK